MVRTLSESEMNNLKSYFPGLKDDQKYIIAEYPIVCFVNKATTEEIGGLYGYGEGGNGKSEASLDP